MNEEKLKKTFGVPILIGLVVILVFLLFSIPMETYVEKTEMIGIKALSGILWAVILFLIMQTMRTCFRIRNDKKEVKHELLGLLNAINAPEKNQEELFGKIPFKKYKNEEERPPLLKDLKQNKIEMVMRMFPAILCASLALMVQTYWPFISFYIGFSIVMTFFLVITLVLIWGKREAKKVEGFIRKRSTLLENEELRSELTLQTKETL